MSRGNESAYPFYHDFNLGHPNGEQHAGLTKRELFAAMAIQGLIAQSDRAMPVAVFAKEAVKCADALLAALEEKKDD